MQGFSIGQLAKSADVSVDTIRFYEKTGLLHPHGRRPSGFREYSEPDLKRLKFIRRGRLLGFSLDEIAELLALEGEQAPGASAFVREKVQIIDRKIEELHRWRSCLMEFIERDAGSGSRRQSMLDCFAEGPADALETHLSRAPLRESNDQD